MGKKTLYAGIATTVLGLGSAYYCQKQSDNLRNREDLTELHAIRNVINAAGLQYVSANTREATEKELEARLEILENNPEIREAEKRRENYLLGFFIFGFVGMLPVIYTTRAKREEE
jgi:hypothetical protein